MVDTDTAVTPVDIVDLIARLEPEQQMQLFKTYEKISLQDQRRQTALELENRRSRNSSVLANQEHQNKLAEIRYQEDREDQRAAMKGQTAVALTEKEHEHKVERMQVELQNHIALAEVTTKRSVITTLMEENGKVRTSMLTRMEKSQEVRDEVFKMQVGAVIQEKLAQKQHRRDMEKMQLANSLKQSEHYFQGICQRLSKLLDDSKDDKAKQEIARLYEMWDKEENKDNYSL